MLGLANLVQSGVLFIDLQHNLLLEAGNQFEAELPNLETVLEPGQPGSTYVCCVWTRNVILLVEAVT